MCKGLPPTIARILAARDIVSDRQIDYSLKHLLPPQTLTNINAAAELLAEAVMADANIVIVGDFDVDGATSCALAMRCLRAFGLANVSYLVPNRFEYGYGLTPEIVGVAAMRQPDIIITVDNGISSNDGVYAAQQLGISVLITDHHLPGDELPTAEVIVNPNLQGDRFASKNLAGVGVIFYVMLALRAQLRQTKWFSESSHIEPNMSQFLDLVALGTVADVVPLDQNNRILVQQGLQRIREGKSCVGIEALLTVGKRNSARLAASDLGFAVAPRLNAAGRLDDMTVGIECLLTDDIDTAARLAQQLDELNRERRAVEQTMQQDALSIVENLNVVKDDSQQPCIYILHEESWHQGVVGLVASRIKERTNRPVVALAPGDAEGEWKGSARSVEGVHIRDIFARLDAQHPGLMSKFGGHAMAAGLSIAGDKIPRFIEALNKTTEEMTACKDWSQIIWTDGKLEAADFTIELADQMRVLTPWGQAMPEPLFEGCFEVLEARTVGDIHAKLKLQPEGTNLSIDAICFFYLNDHPELPEGEVRAIYRLDVNEFRQRQSLQLIVQTIL